ncbi:hypothetical protein Goari_015043, partial [Gossypium aridum]|nr:hypothetical protein [Gossypium aridum]
MVATRFDIDKLNGITNFNLWQVQMTTILIQSNLEKVFTEKKLPDTDESEWDRDNLSFKDVKGHLLGKDKINNEFGSNSKSNRQASVLVVESNDEDLAGANLANDKGDDF